MGRSRIILAFLAAFLMLASAGGVAVSPAERPEGAPAPDGAPPGRSPREPIEGGPALDGPGVEGGPAGAPPVPPGRPIQGPLGAQWTRPVEVPKTGPSPSGAPVRGGRVGPDVTVIGPTYTGPDPAIGRYGAAAVGRTTQFGAMVYNIGDTDASAVAVKFTITDYFKNVIGEHDVQLPSLTAGTGQPVTWNGWSPLYSTEFTVNITATTAGDPDTANDGAILSDLKASRWLDTAESTAGWTGDLDGLRWHLTNTVQDDVAPGHSAPWAWYCGAEGGASDQYPANLDASLVSPPLDLRTMNPNYYVLFNFHYFGVTAPPDDRLDVFATDDDGATWHSLFATLSGDYSSAWQDWVSHWTDYDGDGVVDPGEPHQVGLDLHKFMGKLIKLKFRFRSDATLERRGLYLDDFTLRGWENLNDVALLRISSSEVDQLGVEQTYTTTFRNIGQALQPPFVVNFTVTDGTSLTQTLSGLGPGETRDLTWKWTPIVPGNFSINCVAFPLEDDVGSDNSLWRPVHVAAGEASLLLVDDDSGPGNNGALRTLDDADVQWGMADALTFTEHDTYLVANDGEGPPAEVLARYGAVIWVTGYDDLFSSRTGTLTPRDVSALTQFLDGGGRLWISSFELLWDVWVVRGLSDFVVNYLHVRSFSTTYGGDDDAGMPNPLDGVPEDPITDNLHLGASAPPLGLWDKSDRLRNDSLSPGIFYQYNYDQDPLAGPFNALRFSGTYKLVFFGFEYTFITAPEDRALLAAKVLEWLWKGVSISSGTGGAEGTVLPGGTAFYNLTLSNTESRGWTLDLLGTDAPPPGWTARTIPSVLNASPSVQLSPLGELDILLEVVAPPSELAGQQANITVLVRLSGSPYLLSLTTRTTVLSVAGVALECSLPERTADAGEVTDFTVAVVNRGNFENRVNLSLSGEAAGWGRLSRETLFLTAGGKSFVQVSANVSRDALSGPHRMTVRAEARKEGLIFSDLLDLTISVNASHLLKFETLSFRGGSSVNLALSLKAVLGADISNYGNVGETAVMSLRASFPNWQQWSLPTDQRLLQPFEKMRTLDLTLGIPASAPAGTYDFSARLSYLGGEDAETREISLSVQRPDLSVAPEDIRFSTSRPGIGESFEIDVTVHDLGAEVRGAAVSFNLNNQSLGTVRTAETILGGGTAHVVLVHRGLAHGANYISVKVDPADEVPEVREDNNEAGAHLNGHQADLSLGPVSFRPVGRTGPVTGKSLKEGLVELSVLVSNSGAFSLDVGSVEVNFSVDGRHLETSQVSVAAGAQVEATALWTAKSGTHRISVTVDPAGKVDELSESNNLATDTVKVSSPAGVGTDWGWVLLGVGAVSLAVVAAVVVLQRRPSDEEE